MSENQPVPGPLLRPKLAKFLWDRDVKFAAAGDALGRTREWVRLICLPFDDARRRVPDEKDLERIYAWTNGEITPADFYPPHLNQPPAPAEAALQGEGAP